MRRPFASRWFLVLLALSLWLLPVAPALADDPPPTPGPGPIWTETPQPESSKRTGPDVIEHPQAAVQPAATYNIYIPLLSKPPCQTTGETYNSISISGPPTDRPAENHGDINLALRGYELTTGVALNLVTYGGDTDAGAPQLFSLFTDNRTPTFSNAYRVHHWNWQPAPAPGTRGPVITDWATTLIGMATAPGELIRVPDSGYTIGSGYAVMVLYAAPTRITLKYTREDNVVYGYTLHVENICVDANLIALYNQRNSQGRSQLPALREGQAFGRAGGNELGVAIRDTGAFMDPRSRNDWWKGR